MRTLVLATTVMMLVSACDQKKETGVDKSTTSAKTEAIPTDFVLNPILPDDTKQKAALQLKSDAGLDASFGVNATEEPSADEGDNATIVEPGQEPRAERRYALTVGKTETRALTVRAASNAGGQAQEQPPIKMTLAITPLQKSGKGFTVDTKITKVEIIAANDAEKAMAAQASQQLSAIAGLGAVFEVSALGHVSEPQLTAPPDPRKAQIAQQILPMLLPMIETLFAPLPKGAIGVGAKWESKNKQTDQGMTVDTTSSFTMKSWTNDSGTITGVIARTADKQPIADPRAPKGATMSLDGKSTYEWTVRLDKPSLKITSESTQNITMSDGKKTQAQSVKMKQTLE
jgi:hypothetical protein